MKNIHILPTDKPSRVYRYNGVLGLAKSFQYGSEVILNQNIYITSNEEIKEGNYYIDELNQICRAFKNDAGFYKTCKKIILTTDTDLIKDGVQAIDDEFLEWFVKNPSCEFVEVEHYNNQCRGECGICDNTCGNWYKTIIPKQETLEEVARIKHRELSTAEIGIIPNFVDGFIEGAKWQQQNNNLYSEEEVLKLLHNYRNHFELYRNIQVLPNDFFGWFEQNKKK